MVKIGMVKAASAHGPKRSPVNFTLRWQSAISRLGRAMASKLSLDAVFREFVAGIKPHIPCDRIVIHRVGAQNSISRAFVLSSLPDDTLETPSDLYNHGRTVTEWVVRQRRAFIRQDTSVEREFETDERLARAGIGSYVSVPLIYQDRVVGSFHVAAKKPRSYSKRELAFLQSVAEWLAIAMEKARLFQEIHRLLEEQGVIHEVAPRSTYWTSIRCSSGLPRPRFACSAPIAPSCGCANRTGISKSAPRPAPDYPATKAPVSREKAGRHG